MASVTMRNPLGECVDWRGLKAVAAFSEYRLQWRPESLAISVTRSRTLIQKRVSICEGKGADARLWRRSTLRGISQGGAVASVDHWQVAGIGTSTRATLYRQIQAVCGHSSFRHSRPG